MTSSPAPAPEPTTQERLAWMGKNSKKLIIALVALIVAAVVVIFSFSLFTSSSANPGNMVASGTMELDNSKEGVAILTVDALLPGQTGEPGTVEISNVGDADGDFTLTASTPVDDPADPPFSSVLTLVVLDGSTEVYNGPLASVGTVDLGTWSAGDTHTYTFTVTMAETAGNEFQNAQSTLDFTWDATQSTD